jgi:hypothetical protein
MASARGAKLSQRRQGQSIRNRERLDPPHFDLIVRESSITSSDDKERIRRQEAMKLAVQPKIKSLQRP